jgi:hypothetical protein
MPEQNLKPAAPTQFNILNIDASPLPSNSKTVGNPVSTKPVFDGVPSSSTKDPTKSESGPIAKTRAPSMDLMDMFSGAVPKSQGNGVTATATSSDKNSSNTRGSISNSSTGAANTAKLDLFSPATPVNAKGQVDLFTMFNNSSASGVNSTNSSTPVNNSNKSNNNNNIPIATSSKGASNLNASKKAAASPLMRADSGLNDFDPFGTAGSPGQPGRRNPGDKAVRKESDYDERLVGDGIRIDGQLDEGVLQTMKPRTTVKYVAPTESQQNEINMAAALKVEEMKAVDQMKEQEREAVKDAETPELLGRLDEWSTKTGGQKHLRTLLSSLQQVLWEDSGWHSVGLSELMDFNSVKKQYRKAVMLVHPDKVQHGTPHQKVVAERCFEVLNAAWAKFQTEEKR